MREGHLQSIKTKTKHTMALNAREKKRIGVTEGQQVKEEAFQRMISGETVSNSMSE